MQKSQEKGVLLSEKALEMDKMEATFGFRGDSNISEESTTRGLSEIENGTKEPEDKVFTEVENEIAPPDGGWGWAVCFAAFMTNFTVSGIICSNGIVLLALIDLYNESVSKTSLVGAIISGASMFGGPFVLLLVLFKASHRQIMMVGGVVSAAAAVASTFAPNIETLIFTYGVLAGMSLAMNFFAANIILGFYFTKKRALALGIANSGSGSGNFLLSYLTERSISFYGIRGTFFLIGGLLLNLTVYGALCRPLKPISKQSSSSSENQQTSTHEKRNIAFKSEDGSKGRQDKETASSCQSVNEGTDVQKIEKERVSVSQVLSLYCDKTIFKNKLFGLLAVIFLLWSVGDSMSIYLPAYADSVGLSRSEGALVISVVGFTSTISQIVVGFLADVVHIPISNLLCISLIGMVVTIASVPHCQSFAALAATAAAFSTSYNFGVALRIAMVAAVFGVENMSSGFSLISILMGIGYSVFPIGTGVVYDATRSFSIVFYAYSAIVSLAAILSFGLVYAQRKGQFVE